MDPRSEQRLIGHLKRARRIMMFTGAGISTASGIPDFRGPNGVWKRRQPVYFDDFMRSEKARIEHWEYKLEAWNAFRDARPNRIHTAITDLHRTGKLLMCVTQNIDGLHTRAGLPRDRMVEIHGTNAEIECLNCGKRSDPDAHFAWFSEHRKPPICACGGYLKPATISFGQMLREDDLTRAAQAAQQADVVVALGSTLSVYPAASFPLAAAERGIPYIIINRGETDHDALPCVDLRLEGNVLEIFPPAVEKALSGQGG